MIVENSKRILIVNIKLNKFFEGHFQVKVWFFCCCLFGYGGDINA